MVPDDPPIDGTRFGGVASTRPGERPLVDRVGPYRIIRVLGEGGMGVVYLAEQDEPVKREVALKILRAGANTRDIVARFETERKALALMEHPNITRVFDAGETESGLPYFVMERVQGVPITDHAARHRLSTRQRVQLFIQVCRAVQHAHQKGIIHRDIKPSNVLVSDADGEVLVKVIDFGIAKATAPSEDGARITATGMVIGTPAYMSPEQFTSESGDIDTRTDIYSMGVLLYELVAGVLPFDAGHNSGWAAIFAQRVTVDVPPPSSQYAALGAETRTTVAEERGTDPDDLRRSLRGDLDCVILKALDRDRDRRYDTANSLARDLENYLENKPVSARPASGLYRARKFARRHRAAVTFASAFLVLLVAVAIGATLQAQRLARARAIAVARQGQAEDLIGYMLGDLRTSLTSIGKLDLLDSADRKALAYFAAVPESELSAEEMYRRAEALQNIGEVRRAQGKTADATILTNQSLALAEALVAREPANGRWQLGLLNRQYAAGLLQWQQGNLDSALRYLEPYLAQSERTLKLYPESLSYHAGRAYALNNVGFVKEGTGDLTEAYRSYASSLSIMQNLVRRDPGKAEWQVALGAAYNATAVAQRKLGDLEGALANHRAELAVRQALSDRDTTNLDWRRFPGTAHSYLGDLRLWMGDVDGALADVQAARRIYASLVANDSTNMELRLSLAASERRLGQLRLERGEAAEALATLGASRGQLQRVLAAAPSNARARRELASADVTYARTLVMLGRTPQALVMLGQTTAVADSALAARPRDWEWRKTTADAHLALAQARRGSGDAAGARVSASRALDAVESLAKTSQATDMLALQASALVALGRADDARPAAATLARRGYRLPSFMTLLRGKGLSKAP